MGHIGSALSVADLMAVIYTDFLRISDPAHPDRDRFVLSKGHAALALYAALHLRGWISREQLATYCTDGSLLGTHPEFDLPGVDFCSGSLGHGLSLATGAALAARMQGSSRRVCALLSDGECNEGSVWEAVLFAAHHRLSNLVAVVDVNGQQALGRTRDVLNMEPVEAKWSAFGWDAVVVDGHDTAAITRAFAAFADRPGQPHALLARTTFGKGVSYMEGALKWHYWPMSDEEYRLALSEQGALP